MPRKKLPAEVLEFFKKQGAKGGKLGGIAGGKKAAANMTPEQRTERARNAVAAREAKRKAGASPKPVSHSGRNTTVAAGGKKKPAKGE